MARLPQPGSDDGNWGNILNDYLSQTHNIDGTLKANTVGASQIQDNQITSSKIVNATITQAKLDSTLSDKIDAAAAGGGSTTIADGSITTAKLADGAITSAKIADGTIIDADISTSAAIAQSKISGLTAALSGKEPTVIAGTTSQYYRGDKSWQTLDKTAVGLANVDNTSDANKPVSTATQTALSTKADDIAVVHLAGAETITGNKTFSGTTIVPTPSAPTHAATKGYVDGVASSGGTPDADGTTKGIIQLTGDLTGTATNPVIATGAITSAKIADGTVVDGDINASAAISQSKISNLVSDLAAKASSASVAAKADDSAVVHLTGSETITGNKTFSGTTIVATPSAPTHAATKAYVDTAASSATVPDADSTTKGKIQLAGDLSGTAASPTVPALANKADTSAVLLKASNLSDVSSVSTARTNLGLGTAATRDFPASGDATTSQVVYGTDTRLTNQRTPSDTSVTTAKLADGAVTGAKVAASLKPSGTAATTDEALRALGTTAGTAAAGNDARLNGDLTVVERTAGSYTLGLSDNGTVQLIESASATVVSVPTNASVAFPVGTTIELVRWGSGGLTVAAVNSGTTTIGQSNNLYSVASRYGSAFLVKVRTDSWALTGDLG